MSAAQAAEDRFFSALLSGNAPELEDLITEDFAIVDVISGAVTDRASFLGAFRRGLLMFTRVEVIERFTRLHGNVAIIVGRTEMAGSHDKADFAVSSRYTHVRGLDDQWRLVTAQGTKIIDERGRHSDRTAVG